jgi:putative NADH-flavin reductase
MKITIFGATGRTGLHLVSQAIGRGHAVTVFVRNPAKLGAMHSRVSVMQGDLRSQEQVAQAIDGAEAVVSVLGPTQNEATFEVSEVTRRILDGMQQHGVRRLIISAGAGVGDPNDEPQLFNKSINLVLRLTARYVYEDMLKTVDIVRNSQADWIIVRAPMLTDDPANGQIRAGWVRKGTGARLSRADMAAFMLDQLESERYSHQAPAISN